MKFIKLEIKNIASIGEATIPFDTAPLSTEPLFLISGATGSGKSTILDAICLALYGTAPRLEGYGNESYEDKKLNIAGNDENVRISNPCQLVRRNTGEAYARLTFIGNDEKHYTAIWHATRGTKRKLDVKLKAESTLYCTESDTTINKRVAEEISRPEVVGLKFEEFCRTTLLAQGAFTRFLNSKSSEKSDILEKLTGTEIYSEISKQIYRTYCEKNRLYEENKRITASYKLLSAEERENKTVLLKEEEEKISALKKKSEEIEEKLTWLKNYANYNNAAQEAGKYFAEITEKAQSPESIQEKELLKEWKATEEVRRNHTLHTKLQLESKKNNSLKETLQKTYTQLIHSSHIIQKTIEEQTLQLNELQKRLTNAEKDVPMYENAGTLIAQMQEFARKNHEEKKISFDINKKQHNLPQINQQLEQLSVERKNKESLLLAKNQEHKKATEELHHQPSSIELNKQKEKIEKIASALKETEQAQERCIRLQEKINDIKTKLQKAKNEEIKTENDRKKAEAERKKQENLYETIHLRIENHAKALRAKLRVGDKCPVCGETVNHLLQESEITEMLQPIEQEKEKAIKKHEEINAAYNEITSIIKSYNELLDDSTKQLTTEIKEHEKHTTALDKLCQETNITTKDKKEIYATINNERTKIITQQQTNEILSKKVLSLYDEIVKIRQELTSVMEKYAMTLSLQKQTENTIEILKQQQNTYKKNIKHLQCEINKLITIENWETNTDETINNLQQRATAYTKAKEKSEKITQNIAQLNELSKRIANYRDNITTCFPTLQQIQQNNIPSIPAEILEKKWEELSNNCMLLKNNIQRIDKEIEEYEKQIENFYNNNPQITREKTNILNNYTEEQIATIEKRQAVLLQEVEKSKTLLDEWIKKCKELMLQRPELKEEENSTYLTTQKEEIENTRSETEKRVGGYFIELKQDAENNRLLEKERAKTELLEKETSKWKRLSDIFGSAEGNKFKAIAQSYILLQLLENANHYLRQFTTRYELTTQPGSLVILINDRDEGDISRPANTLSGGESFMVSLALALGLSSLNRNNFTPDTLFIDEGFGTLSGDCLNTVIETLEVLHSMGNRRVGIISHVNELYERITTRIEVKKRTGISEIKITR